MSDYQVLSDDIQFYLAAEDQTRTEDLDRMAIAFAELAKLTNQRLRQCDVLLQKGLRGEALQLAEQEPKVLELAQLVSSFDRSHWDELVSLYSLPRPEPLLSTAAENLGNAYWKQEPLTKLLSLHRLLAIGRAPLSDRLSVLRRLQAADTANPIWEQDVRDFEKARLAELDQDVKQARDIARLQELQSEIQNEEWSTPPSPTVIKNLNGRLAQLQRSQARTDLEQLKAQIDEAYSAQDLPALRGLKKKWAVLTKSAGLPADDVLAQYVAPVFAWLADEDARQTTEASWTAAVAALEEALKDNRTSAEQLTQFSNAVMQTGKPIPPTLASRTRLRIEQLQLNAVNSRRSKIGLVAAAVVVLLAIAGWFGWQQWQWSGVKAAVARADEQIVRLEFEEARKQLQTYSGYASYPVMIEVQQRLKDAEGNEKTRQASFRTISQQVAGAPTHAAATELLKKLDELKKVPADQREIDRLTAQLGDKHMSETALREQQADTILKPVEEALSSLRAMDEVRVTASDSIAALDQARAALREAEAIVAKASEAMKNRHSSALTQWTALKKHQDGQVRRNDILKLMTANALIEPAKVDPATRLQAFETAMQSYAKTFSEDARASDFLQPSERVAALGVLQFGRLGASWAQDKPASPLTIRRQLGEVQALLKSPVHGPQHAVAQEYKSYLDALLQQQFSASGDAGGLRDNLVSLFNRNFMTNLHILKVNPPNPNPQNLGMRVYYLGEARQFVSTKPANFIYLLKNRDKEGKSEGISYKDLLVGSTEEAPHVVLARDISKRFAGVTHLEWRAVCLQTLEDLWNHPTIDPLLRFLLMQQVAETAGLGDLSLKAALAPLSTVLADKKIDDDADWMDPVDGTAIGQRRLAQDLLDRARSRGLADFAKVKTAAAAADRELQAKLSQRVLCVGWLARSSKGSGWECRSLWQPDGPNELLVLIPASENSFRWLSLGRVGPTGWEINVAADQQGLREGKLVFAVAAKTPAEAADAIPVRNDELQARYHRKLSVRIP